MPAKKKTTKAEPALYRVTYSYYGQGGGMAGYTATNKEIRASGWAVRPGTNLVEFYGSEVIFAIPERSLVSIEKL